MNRNEPEWTGMDRNDTGMDRNDTGMDRNDTGMDRNDTGMDRNEIHFTKHTHVSDWFSKTFLRVLVLKFLCCGLGGMKSLL